MSLAALSLLTLGGCTSLKVGLGWRIRLEKLPVSSMEAQLPGGPGISPGEKSPLVVEFQGTDGKTYRTEGAGKGKVLWSDLEIKAKVVTVNAKGIISLPQDPRDSDGKLPHIAITAPSHPELSAELDIPLRYDHAFSSYHSGASGTSGWDGQGGQDGSSGSMGSMDPDHPSAGGDGSDGSNGSDGQDGDGGGEGPALQVRVALRPGIRPLIQVGVYAEGREEFFLIDPRSGSLTVSSDGGPGGSGGRGGRGGSGGSGGSGSPSGRNGSDGMTGRDGWNGSQGRGGSITVIYDPQAEPYLGALHLSNRGQPSGPPPLFRMESVAPLW